MRSPFELSRYRPGLLRVEPQVAGLRLSGAFQLDDTDTVLDSLARMLPIDVLYRTPVLGHPHGPQKIIV